MQNLTTQDVAHRLGVSDAVVRFWCKAQKFPHAQLVNAPRGYYWSIPEADLQDFTPPTKGRPRKLTGATK